MPPIFHKRDGYEWSADRLGPFTSPSSPRAGKERPVYIVQEPGCTHRHSAAKTKSEFLSGIEPRFSNRALRAVIIDAKMVKACGIGSSQVSNCASYTRSVSSCQDSLTLLKAETAKWPVGFRERLYPKVGGSRRASSCRLSVVAIRDDICSVLRHFLSTVTCIRLAMCLSSGGGLS
jgi:hypothetical protein